MDYVFEGLINVIAYNQDFQEIGDIDIFNEKIMPKIKNVNESGVQYQNNGIITSILTANKYR